MSYFLYFASRKLIAKKFENGNDLFCGEQEPIVRKGILDAPNEIGSAAILHRRCCGPPLFVVDAAQELGKLGSEMCCIVDWKPVANGLQDRPQQAEGTMLV